MILCSVILRTERGETEPGWQMARPKSETRNHKNLRLIQAMPESLLGWQGEDRMRKVEYVASEKFPITLCSDKVNKERGSTTGSLREPQLCHHQGRKSHNPWSGKGSSGASCQQLTCLPCLLPCKNIAPLFCQGMCGCLAVTATTSSIWGKAVMLAACMRNSPELLGSRLAHGDSTYNSNICKNFRDEHTMVFAKAVQDQTNCH